VEEPEVAALTTEVEVALDGGHVAIDGGRVRVRATGAAQTDPPGSAQYAARAYETRDALLVVVLLER